MIAAAQLVQHACEQYPPRPHFMMVINMNMWYPSLRTFFAALLLLVAPGCATLSGSGEAQQRQNLVVVPTDAGIVRSVRWESIRRLRPLNERMILLEVNRQPHLLVLARRCVGLRPNSTFLFDRRSSRFEPRRDSFDVVAPGVSGFATTCVPDTLYTIRDEDVGRLLAAT